MVTGSVLLIAFVGHTEDRVCRVEPDAPLEAAGGHVAAVALQTDLVDQVFRALVQMGEAVDFLSAKRRRRAKEATRFFAPGMGTIEGAG